MSNRTASMPGVASDPSGITLRQSLRSEALVLRRSPLVALHLICALVPGLACGCYFAFTSWDASMGTDAFVQLIGAAMPLMTGIICGLDAYAEAEATRFTNMLSTPARIPAFAARVVALWTMGALALALSVGSFALPLALVGKTALSAAGYLGAIAGLALGSLPLYPVFYAVAMRWGRNVSIAAGAAGLMLALFSVGGLAHGLMTSELTAASANALSYLPTSWPTLLGSLFVEHAIAVQLAELADSAVAIALSLRVSIVMCIVSTVAISVAAAGWLQRFEPPHDKD